ncbi:MAG: FUSC family protein [Acidimicrobiales bacterium]
MGQYVAHQHALAGQLRALRLGVAEAVSGERRAWHSAPTWRRAEPSDARTAAAVLRDGLSLHTSAGRHALRLAVAVPLATAIALGFHLARGYWVPSSVAVVLRADYATLWRRGTGRVAGTALGAAGAALLIGALRLDLGTDVLLVAVLAWAAFTTWTASFPLGVTFITALVLVLLSMSLPDPSRTALDRLVDVALGGAIAVASYRVWPTSADAGVRASLSGLFRALGTYLAGSLRLVAGTGGTPESLSDASPAARVAGQSPPPPPALRALYDEAAAHLDELVDAVNAATRIAPGRQLAAQASGLGQHRVDAVGQAGVGTRVVAGGQRGEQPLGGGDAPGARQQSGLGAHAEPVEVVAPVPGGVLGVTAASRQTG